MAKTPVTKVTTKAISAESSKTKGFADILETRRKEVANKTKTADLKDSPPKSAESTASESSSDSNEPAPVVVKTTKRSPKTVTPVESTSSSSSDEEELDYSQSLLADLTKNG
eukprot:jgi/Phyca11/508406/fgenesh2_kg.PHYCAscaffold_34_\